MGVGMPSTERVQRLFTDANSEPYIPASHSYSVPNNHQNRLVSLTSIGSSTLHTVSFICHTDTVDYVGGSSAICVRPASP
jgi:hypothetical protein